MPVLTFDHTSPYNQVAKNDNNNKSENYYSKMIRLCTKNSSHSVQMTIAWASLVAEYGLSVMVTSLLKLSASDVSLIVKSLKCATEIKNLLIN